MSDVVSGLESVVNDDANDPSVVTTESRLLVARARALRERVRRESRASEVRRLGVMCVELLRDGIDPSERARRRLVGMKANACARALERWTEDARGFEVAIERALGCEPGAKSLDAIEMEYLQSVRAFEAYLEENDVLEALPERVTGTRVQRVLSVSEGTQTTLESMRLVREDVDEASARCLEEVCRELSSIEGDVSWTGRLIAEAEQLAAGRSCSSSTFAYGSTPLRTWSELFARCGELRARAMSLESEKLDYVVFGSSLGWLVFYGALTLRARTHRGFEILQTLHDQACRVRMIVNEEPSISSTIEFHHADMLTASLENVGLIVLTSLCWDEEVYEETTRKLATELPQGAFVIDYRDGLLKSAAFNLAHSDMIRLPVSWNPEQRFYVFKKVP